MMLKWLVTKSPSQTSSVDNSVTDDPLATLTRNAKKNVPIYAVSRVNPIFEDESKSVVEGTENAAKCEREERSSPDSPPTDRESVRSSGYGSKETDSVSYKSEIQDEESLNETHKNSNLEQNNLECNLEGSVADIRRSFEVLTNPKLLLNKHDKDTNKVIIANPDYVKNIEVTVPVSPSLHTIPEVTTETECDQSVHHKTSSWPRVSHLAQALQRQAERIHQRREREKFKERLRNRNSQNYKHQVLRFNPLVSVVAQDERYVTEISLLPHKQSKSHKRTRQNLDENFINNINFQLGPCVNGNKSLLNRINENTDQSFQPDSLINEDTLEMMNSPEYETNLRSDDRNLGRDRNLIQNTLPNFGKAIYSNFHPNLSRGANSSHYSLGKNNKSVARAKLNGANVNVAKDLWERSGLKTNGRKLLVNSSSLTIDDKKFTLKNETEDSLNDAKSSKTLNPIENNKNNVPDDLYEYNPSLTRASSSSYNFACHSYEYYTDSIKGIDNLGYINDIGNSTDSLASSSKHSYPFQHSLTEFQKRVSDKLQAGNQEKGLFLTRQLTDYNKYQTNKAKISKNKTYPGKAVQERRFEDDTKHLEAKGFQTNISYYQRDQSHLTKDNNEAPSKGQKNMMQNWEEIGHRYKDDTFPSYFFRHPNSEAPIFAQQQQQQDVFHHDFTLDAKRSHRIMRRSSRSKRRRKCCVGFLVLFAFLSFIGIIIGLSWFSTGGQRLFGPM